MFFCAFSEDEHVHESQFLQAPDVVGMLMGDENLVDFRIVGHPITIEVFKTGLGF